jgi:hypothetical protein
MREVRTFSPEVRFDPQAISTDQPALSILNDAPCQARGLAFAGYTEALRH